METTICRKKNPLHIKSSKVASSCDLVNITTSGKTLAKSRDKKNKTNTCPGTDMQKLLFKYIQIPITV